MTGFAAGGGAASSFFGMFHLFSITLGSFGAITGLLSLCGFGFSEWIILGGGLLITFTGSAWCEGGGFTGCVVPLTGSYNCLLGGCLTCVCDVGGTGLIGKSSSSSSIS